MLISLFVCGSLIEAGSKEEQDGGTYMVKRSFIIGTVHIILFKWLNQEGRKKGKIKHEFVQKFCRKSLKE
jgi:hypothetical protein